MSEAQLASAEIERLERIVRGDAGAPAFPALAEAHRRRGNPKRAEEVARAGLAAGPLHVAGGVALGLALLDQGRSDEAREVLERALEATPEQVLAQRALEELAETPRSTSPLGNLDSELDAAFEQAQPDEDAMLDANDLAREAVRRADPTPDEEPLSVAGSRFATRTVADLLERQGDVEGASAVRRELAEGTAPDEEVHRRRVVETLEGWLRKLSRGESR